MVPWFSMPEVSPVPVRAKMPMASTRASDEIRPDDVTVLSLSMITAAPLPTDTLPASVMVMSPGPVPSPSEVRTGSVRSSEISRSAALAVMEWRVAAASTVPTQQALEIARGDPDKRVLRTRPCLFSLRL